MINPTIPDLRKCKLITSEEPKLDKALLAYKLLERQLTIKQLQDKAEKLTVRKASNNE